MSKLLTQHELLLYGITSKMPTKCRTLQGITDIFKLWFRQKGFVYKAAIFT